jgi:hypothetical protein
METRKLMGVCPVCGNLRDGLEASCPFCASHQVPLPNPALSGKIFVVDLEAGMPTVEEALERLDDILRQAGDAGIRLVKVIHGYGSSGRGGHIREAFRQALQYHRWANRVQEYFPGESLGRQDGPAAFQALPRRTRQAISGLAGRSGNPGITLLLMGHDSHTPSFPGLLHD